MNFLDFLAWEEKTRDTVDFKTAYVDMTAFTEEDVALLGGDNRSKVERGDLVSGLLLSQIVYWHLPSASGADRLKVQKKGRLWLAKAHSEWWDEIRISEEQAKRGIKRLCDLGIIDVEYHRFNGLRTTHIAINAEGFMRRWERVINPDRKADNTPTEKGNKPRPLTETTPKITAETTSEELPAAQVPLEEKELPPHQDMFGAICEVTKADPKLRSIQGRVARLGKEMREAGYTAADVRRVFGEGGWWYTEHWKGKRGECPHITELVTEIQKGLSWRSPRDQWAGGLTENEKRLNEIAFRGNRG